MLSLLKYCDKADGGNGMTIAACADSFIAREFESSYPTTKSSRQ